RIPLIRDCYLRLCPTGTGTEHKRHKKGHKRHKNSCREADFCASCVLFVPFVFRSRWAKPVARAGTTGVITVSRGAGSPVGPSGPRALPLLAPPLLASTEEKAPSTSFRQSRPDDRMQSCQAEHRGPPRRQTTEASSPAKSFHPTSQPAPVP